MTARLARILVYPLKSGDGQSAASATILPSGAIQHDRRYAIADASGRFVNAKRTPLFHTLRTHVDPIAGTISLEIAGGREVFSLSADGKALEVRLSDYFELPVRLVENAEAGLPDDTEAPGPTVVSTATLATVASWFPGMSVDEARRRFRANLEIDGVEPFWEDRLFGAAGQTVSFRIGQVTLGGVNPCQRCVVPSRDSQTGDVWPEFAKQFSQHRESRLPAWAERTRFNHFYRLSVNTVLVGTPGVLSVDDAVELIDE